MAKTEFHGEPLDIAGLLDMLEGQGLAIEDRERATHILQNVSYSRLKPYLVTLMEDRATHRFQKGASMELAYALYGFDRRLRELIFHEMEKIEISVRTHLAYATSGSEHGYWFTESKYFKNASRHRYILSRIQQELRKSDNDGIIEFREKYTNEFPPSWLTLEATSMGTLSTIYDEMAPGSVKRSVAQYYGLSDDVFAAWLHHLVYVRNTCAHHSRLWNKRLTIRGKLPEKPRHYFPYMSREDTERIYFTLCMVKYMQNVIKPTNTFAQRLRSLIDHFPQVDVKKMGFPRNWKEDPLWKVDAE